MKVDLLKIEFLEGPCPMQGWGTIAGHEFFFRARWSHWSFAISEDPNIDPTDIYDSERGFYVEEKYGKTAYDAGYMPKEEAEEIIKRCAAEYLAKKQLN